MRIYHTTYFLLLSSCAFLLTACFNDSTEVRCGTKDPLTSCGGADSFEKSTNFDANCAVCHMRDKNSTGPALRNVFERIPSEQWFDQFVRNEDSLMRSGDTYTLEIQQWSVVRGNHHFSYLSDEQLTEIKAYLRQN